MKIALLGLPQAGKKTLFSLLTGNEVPPSRRPDDVIEGSAPVFDPRLPVLAGICHPERTVYARNQFVLCPDVPFNGSSREWLESAGQCDLLCIVVRAFASDAIYHPADSVAPNRDVDYVRGELLLADMATIDKRLERLAKEKRAGLRPEQQREETALGKCMAALDAGQTVADASLDPAEQAALRSLELVSRLPILIVHNVGENDLREASTDDLLRVSCAIEADIMSMDDDAERREFLIPRADRLRIGPRKWRGVRRVGAYVLLHDRRGRMPRLADPQRIHRARRGRAHSYGHSAWIHPRGSHQV